MKRMRKMIPKEVSVKSFIWRMSPPTTVMIVDTSEKNTEVRNQLTQYADDRSPIVIIPFLKDFSFSFKISVVIKINVSMGTSKR